jgi:Acyl-CoA dehydrogenase, N-terminal domain
MSLAGAIGGHTMVARLFGTEEQKRAYLPPIATGEVCAIVTEPGGGPDLQNMATTALPGGLRAVVRRLRRAGVGAPGRTDGEGFAPGISISRFGVGGCCIFA